VLVVPADACRNRTFLPKRRSRERLHVLPGGDRLAGYSSFITRVQRRRCLPTACV